MAPVASPKPTYNTAIEAEVLIGPNYYENRPRILDLSALKVSEIDSLDVSEYRLMNVVNTLAAKLDGAKGPQQLQVTSPTSEYFKNHRSGSMRVSIERIHHVLWVCMTCSITTSRGS